MSSEEHEDAKLRTRSALIAACAVSAVGAVYLVWTIAKGPLPHPPLHSAVTTAIGVGTVIAWLFYIATRGADQRREDLAQGINLIRGLITETEIHRTTAQSRLHNAVVDALENRSDIPTDRIVAIVSPGADVINLPSGETREAFRNLSRKLSGDNSGDMWGRRNVRE